MSKDSPILMQSALIRPDRGQLVLTVTWRLDRDHSLVKREVRAGMADDLLSLGVVPAPPATDARALARTVEDRLHAITESLATELHWEQEDPFP